MSSQISLPTLIRRVPVCLEGITLDALWSVFTEGDHDCVVVINQQQYPAGVVYLRSLTFYLFSQQNKQLPLTKTILADLSDRLIEPLLLVPSHLTWPEFWAYLQQIGHDLGWNQKQSKSSSDHKIEGISPLAIINNNNQFLGLIDLSKLLQHLVFKHPQPSESKPPIPPQNKVKTPEKVPFLTSLVELIEQLPLPMMIQTQQGEVLGQNLAWKQQVGNEPGVLQDAAATVNQWGTTSPHHPLMETAISAGGVARESFSPLVSVPIPGVKNSRSTVLKPTQTQTQTQTQLPDQTLDASSGQDAMPKWCDMGSNPETYICICPTAKQERVWQFTRKPLVQPNLGESSEQWWLIIAQDITEQHRVAQELTAKNADLIQMNRLKDEFLACISHELKTPLTAVLGLSSLLKDQVLGPLSDRQARYAKLIHQSGRHLMMVVNDILDLTRIETGQLELTPEGIKIQSVCDCAFETAQQLQQQSRSRSNHGDDNRQFSLEIEPGLETIEADELRLRQMLVNLISNAFKFTPDGGSIGLRVSRWEDWVVFTVWDTGIGIPEDKQHLIFEKFQQLESPLTRQFEGTGLGLVLTQRLARLHGGDVSFISEQGKGTEFTLLLPPVPPKKCWQPDSFAWEKSQVSQSSQEKPPQISRPTTPPQVQSRLILIVEAAPRFIHDLSEQVTSLGYRAIVARTGTEALEKARRLQPRVIFLNPLLPLLSGWDVLTLLKTDPDTCEIPVFITATLGDKKRAIEGSGNGFINLPVQKSDLQLILTELDENFSSEPLPRLTVLWLSPVEEKIDKDLTDYQNGVWENLKSPGYLTRYNQNSQGSHCRILEADDLDQAELLARIWHPDAMVLECIDNLHDPVGFLQELSHEKYLANIPLVTLDAATTQAANQVEGLSVFPCLLPQIGDRSMNSRIRQADPALLQVIQVAVGMSWKSHILVVDLFTLPDLVDPEASEMTDSSVKSKTTNFYPPADPTSKIEQALIQYLQTAGFRGTMGRSWEEILQQLQCQSVDLLLICVRNQASPILQQALAALLAVESANQNSLTIPPILILDHSSLLTSSSQQNTNSSAVQHIPQDLENLTKNLTIKFLSGHVSMTELLGYIQDLM